MKPNPPPINKAIISVVFGAIAFYLNFHAISFAEFPQFKISILMGLLFPLVITLAWGWKYGLLSAFAGGCQSMWWLWQSDGYGIFYSVPVFTLWILWHGAWSAYRRKHKSTKWYHSMYAVELIFRILSELGFYTVFRWLVSFNPPTWAPEIMWTHVPYSWVNFVAIKHIITAYILLLLCHVLLSLGLVRRFFGLDSTPSQKDTTYIISASILLGFFIWFIDDVIMYLAFYEGSGGFLEAMMSDTLPRNLLQKNFFLFVYLILGLLISRLLSQKFERERVLRESEAKYRLLADNLSDVIWTMDLNQRFTYVSPSGQKLLGYTPKEAMQVSLKNMLTPESYEKTVSFMMKGIASGAKPVGSPDGYRILILEYIRKDGIKIWGEVTTSFIRDEDGLPSGIIGIIRDITDRKQAEEKLRESESKYRQLATTAHEVIITMDFEGIITYGNPAAQSIVGDMDIIGIPVKDFIPTELISTHIEMLKARRQGFSETLSYEWPFISPKDDSIIVFETTSSLLIDKSEPSGVMLIGRDITERKKAEEKLRETDARHSAMIANIGDVISIMGTDGIIKYISPNIEKWFGWKPEDIVGTKGWEMIHPDDIERIQKEFYALIKKDNTLGTLEYRSKCKDGIYKWVESTGINRINDTVINGVLLNYQDISERKRDEKEKEILEEHLRQAQKMESIGTLAGGIAHDFNNILSSVIGFTELALDDAKKDSQSEDHLQEIYKAGKRARDLVKQILMFARQTDDALKPIQLDKIAKEALRLLRATIPTSIEIQQEIKSNSQIIGNSTQVHQIFMNLCTNAAYVMEDSGGVLKVGLEDVEIANNNLLVQSGLKPGKYVKVIVSDTGPGIEPDILDSIFEPYFTTKKIGDGTGMGLAMVHGIVESYDGKITVDSELGKGTVFSIYLPIVKKQASFRSYEKEELPSGTECILIVDDELPIAKMGSQILERLGYKVSFRTSSVEALELFRAKSNEFELVITDMTMPNMTGDKLAIELMKIRPELPIILFTGYSKKISDGNAANIGIKAFAYKPIVKADLAKTVRKVLDEAMGSIQ